MSFDPHSSLWHIFLANLIGPLSFAFGAGIVLLILIAMDRAREARRTKAITCRCGHLVFYHRASFAPGSIEAVMDSCFAENCSCAKYVPQG